MTKIKTSVSLSTDSLAWLAEEVNSKRFRSVSHAVDWLIEQEKSKKRSF